MSKKGKRARHEINGYKKDDFSTQENNIMSPHNTFRNEICSDAELADDDIMYIARLHEPNEPIPEGSIGCFKAVGRPSINDKMDAMMDMMRSMQLQIDGLKKKDEEQSLHIYALMMKNFRNDVVQLYYAANEGFVCKNVDNAAQRFGKRNLKVDNIFNQLSAKEQQEIINKLMDYGERNQSFLDTLQKRNHETHPNFMSVDLMRTYRNKVNEMNSLELQCALDPVAIKAFDELIEIPELDDLICAFNVNNMPIN